MELGFLANQWNLEPTEFPGFPPFFIFRAFWHIAHAHFITFSHFSNPKK